jgi:hypothetical protein
MAKSVTDLPPELLGRIFEYLGEHRPDISSCRLVCKQFKQLSSPFLITKVVLARRLTEIAKAQEVAAHPYFSRHITTLIYDVSYFDPYSAEIYVFLMKNGIGAPRQKPTTTSFSATTMASHVPMLPRRTSGVSERPYRRNKHGG